MKTVLILVLAVSMGFQLVAAVYALCLIRITGFRYAWLFISLALCLMAFRRLIPFLHLLMVPDYSLDLVNEIIGLALSALMFAGVLGIGPVFLERKRAEEEVRCLLQEKETLLRELYHRTRNNMQLIKGLIVLQAAEYSPSPEIKELVKSTEQRIQAMSLVHQKLYKSRDLSHVHMGEYIRELLSLILEESGGARKRISLNIQADDRDLLLDTAIPIGLILNELMTNSLKYAFPEGRKGEIRVSLEALDQNSDILCYSDDGVGVGDEFDFRHQTKLGLKLVYDIGEQQIGGKVEMWGQEGFSCRIEYRNDLYQVRI